MNRNRNEQSILTGMKCLAHSKGNEMWPLHSHRKEMSILVGMKCHSKHRLKNYASWHFPLAFIVLGYCWGLLSAGRGVSKHSWGCWAPKVFRILPPTSSREAPILKAILDTASPGGLVSGHSWGCWVLKVFRFLHSTSSRETPILKSIPDTQSQGITWLDVKLSSVLTTPGSVLLPIPWPSLVSNPNLGLG